MSNILIIEDEPVAARHLQRLLAVQCPEGHISATLESIEESIEYLQQEPMPDLVFMDIHLADGLSFRIFDSVGIHCPIIFTTAYDQYAVKAFEVHAIDYLLKPIEVAELRRAMGRIASGENAKPNTEAMHSILKDVRKEKFLIRLNDRIVPVRTDEVAYFYSEDKNSYIVTLGGSSYILDDSLDTIANGLDPAAFFRISRSCIISDRVIDSVSRLMGGRLRISLRPGILAATDFTVSRARVEDFMAWLEK